MSSFEGIDASGSAGNQPLPSLTPAQEDIYLALMGMGFESTESFRVVLMPGITDAELAINFMLSGGNDDEEDEGDGEEDSGEEGDSEVFLPMKMVIVVRKDLNMTPGKVSAQCCHACLAAYRLSQQHGRQKLVSDWEMQGETVITLQVDSDAELDAILREAISRRVVVAAQHDAGRTEVEDGTRTCAAIGPSYSSEIDPVTRSLKLYK